MGNHYARSMADQQRVMAEVLATRPGQPDAVGIVASLAARGLRVADRTDPDARFTFVALTATVARLMESIDRRPCDWCGRTPGANIEHADGCLAGLVRRVLDEIPAGHAYLSTACQHGHHDRCRIVCKFGAEVCACPVCRHQLDDAPAEDAGAAGSDG